MIRKPSMERAGWFWGVTLLVALSTGREPAVAAEVRFQVNDAHVKGRPVAGVRIEATPASGDGLPLVAETDEGGTALVDLEPGNWAVSYQRAGYVPIPESPLLVGEGGQVVTTTLTMMLEAEGGDVSRRIRFVLNWGSASNQAKDLDAHGVCSCGASDAHVYFAEKIHELAGHRVDLDVDDRDWGGPETITLLDPPPGEYRFWVHDYLGEHEPIGSSAVVVRLYFDDLLAAELAPPADLDGREWRPFEAVVVEPDLRPRLARFDEAQLAAGADRAAPPGFSSPAGGGDDVGTLIGGIAACGVFLGLAVLAFVMLLRKFF